MDISDRIQYLVGQCIRKTINTDEVDELLTFMQDGRYSMVLNELEKSLGEEMSLTTPSMTYSGVWKEKADAILKADSGVAEQDVKRKPVYRISFIKYAAASAVLLLMNLFFWHMHKDLKPKGMGSVTKTAVPAVVDIAPGRNRAVLKLADGAIISLDSLHKGNIASQGSTNIWKQDDGKIVYEPTKNSIEETLFNEMSTPNGGQYQLILPDGTKVWMNAASTIKYPVRFDGSQRKVEVKGEIYFEVAKNPKQPFLVDAGNGLEIRVLGTHFNVNTYKDEKFTRTTLLEGAVKITTGRSVGVLKPGQQAEAHSNGTIRINENVDVNAVVAWKNGLFNFNKSDIRGVMNQLSRWYDIDIRYEGLIPGQIYGGEMQRDLNLSQVLKILGNSGVHCRLEKRTLIVMP